jgi:DNA polymerase-3 subunit epsilon
VREVNIWEANYVVVDVETTGNQPTQSRIIDIAAVNLRNGNLEEVFSSLVNPHQFIPAFISQMTGITNEAVFFAPEAKEVMPKFLHSFNFENSIFVAHNANFDYSFVKETLQRIGVVDFEYPVLDTLKLARRVLADTQKKSVGSLAAYFGIKVRNRHTALGDAKATAKILFNLLEIIEEEHEITSLEELLNFQNKRLSYFNPKPDSFNYLEDKLKQTPEAPGVYHFLDSKKKIIYVGKAKNLKARVSSYFRPGNITSPKLKELIEHIRDLTTTETNNELSALVLESKEIKALQPKYNFAGRKMRRLPFLKIPENVLFPTIEIAFDINDNGEYYGPFTNLSYALEIKKILDDNFNLVKCGHSFEGKTLTEPCIYLQMDKCLAPCIKRQEEDFTKKYELELLNIKQFLSGFAEDLIKALEQKMFAYSEKFEFEKANEFKKTIQSIKNIFNNSEKFFNSINEQNFILILPHFESDKMVDVYLFRYARLIYHQTIGKKALPNEILLDRLEHVYFNGMQLPTNLSVDEIEEIKITNSWLNQNKEDGKIIYFEKDKMKTKENLVTLIQEKINELS